MKWIEKGRDHAIVILNYVQLVPIEKSLAGVMRLARCDAGLLASDSSGSDARFGMLPSVVWIAGQSR